MRYVNARFETELKEMTYRIFVTDYLRLYGRFDGIRYADAIAEQKKPIKETRTGDEIIADIKQKLSQFGGE